MPVVIRLVPIESSYQFKVLLPEAVRVTLPDPQIEAPVVVGFIQADRPDFRKIGKPRDKRTCNSLDPGVGAGF